MKQKFFKWLLPFAALALMIIYYLTNIQLPPASSVELKQNYYTKVILVPLDTRPPCQKMVVDAGKMAGIEIITPPAEIMDYYTRKGDSKAVQKWLLENIAQADGAIISVDQLLYGGLLASREAQTTDAERTELGNFLHKLRQKDGDKPIYAFNILPRITPTPTLESDSKKIIKISRLIDEISIFQNVDDMKLVDELKEDIDVNDLHIYLDLFKKNPAMNKDLIRLTQENTLTKFVIGQDDGDGLARILRAGGDEARRVHRRARRDAREHAVRLCDLPRGGVGVLVGDGDDLVEQGGIEDVGHEARADALQTVRARPAAREHGGVLRLDGDRAEGGVLFF